MKIENGILKSEVSPFNPLPASTLELVEKVLSAHSSESEIVTLIERDHGLSARILKLVNTAYYAIPGGVSDIAKALQYMGSLRVAQLLLTA